MLRRGYILINFKKINNRFYCLKPGDFISFFFKKNIVKLIALNIATQKKHLFRVRKKMFRIATARAAAGLKTQPEYYSKSFIQLKFFFKKIPGWTEVDFLSLSFFIVKKSHFADNFLYFNPFLYRLLEFK